MRKPKIDLSGQTFERLTVISYNGIAYRKSGTHYHSWRCICSCGNECIAEGKSLISGAKRSCGCLNKEVLASGNCRRTHGMVGTHLYHIWRGMKDRCLNFNNKNYDRYGGRGIKICNEWLDNFQAFYDWAIENGYQEGLTIDRINNNGNYEPLNCRWVNYIVQANNRSNNHLITVDGETHTVSEWSRITGLNPQLISHRANRGDSNEEIFNKEFPKVEINKLYEYQGEKHTIKEYSEMFGISKDTLHRRIRKGMSIKEAIETPLREAQKERLLTLNGETHNVTEWSKITGIKRNTLFARIREGWSVEDMLTKPLQQGKKGT